MSLISNVDSSTTSYHGSPTNDHIQKTSLTPTTFMGESYHLAMQFMTTGTSSIEEQLAQMNEAIAMLTRTVEEKDMQIVTLLSKLESENDKEIKPDPKKNDNPLNEEPDEEEPIHENKVDTSMGSLSIKQLQDMITNMIKAQYAGTS